MSMTTTKRSCSGSRMREDTRGLARHTSLRTASRLVSATTSVHGRAETTSYENGQEVPCYLCRISAVARRSAGSTACASATATSCCSRTSVYLTERHHRLPHPHGDVERVEQYSLAERLEQALCGSSRQQARPHGPVVACGD